MARCHDMLGQYEDARGAYSTAAALKPDSPLPYAARGELAFKYGKDILQAKADLDRALHIDPNLFEARLTRALVLRNLKAYGESPLDLDALARNEQATVRIHLVRAMRGRRAGTGPGPRPTGPRG